MSARPVICALLLVLGVAAQRPLLLTDLPLREAQNLTERFRERGLRVSVEALASSEFAIRIRQEPRPSLVYGVDAFSLYDLLESDLLLPIPAALRAGLQPFWSDAAGKVLINMAEPWVVAYSPETWSNRPPPEQFDEFVDLDFAGRLSLPMPESARSLWVTLVQNQLRAGFSEERAFSWLASLDARTESYQSDSEACIAALRTGPADVSLLPLAMIVEEQGRGGDLLYQLPKPLIPVQGRGMALLRPVDAELQKLIEFLLEPALALRLAQQAQLIPCPQKGLTSSELPALMREISRRAMPVLPNFGNPKAWLQRWREEVQGKGQQAENLDSLLEFILGLGFFGLLIYVFLRSRTIDEQG